VIAAGHSAGFGSSGSAVVAGWPPLLLNGWPIDVAAQPLELLVLIRPPCNGGARTRPS